MENRFSKRSMIRIYSFSVAMVLVLAASSALAINDALFYRRQLEINHMRSLGNLTGYANEITNTLTKGIYSGTPTQLSLLSAALLKDSAGAKQALEEIPVVEEKLEGAYRFLSQVGDYSISLARKTQADESLTKQDIANLEMLLDYSKELNQSIGIIEQRVRNGEVKLMTDKYVLGTGNMNTDNQGYISNSELAKSNLSTTSTSEKKSAVADLETVKSYATLIYDGPFSDHMLDRAPLLTKDLAQVSREEAFETAKTLWKNAGFVSLVKSKNDPTGIKQKPKQNGVDNNVAIVETMGEPGKVSQGSEAQVYPQNKGFSFTNLWGKWIDQTKAEAKPQAAGLQSSADEQSLMPLYCFDGEGVSVGITKNGAAPAYYTNSREISEPKMTSEESVSFAQNFLEQSGFANMKATYHEESGGICTTNFAYNLNGVTYYTDLIKVGVALDTGEIVSMDARTYISNHHKRTLATNLISQNTAIETVGTLVKVDKVALAVIPTNGGSEKLCYEVAATGSRGHQLLIYVNAINGVEEQLLILIKTSGGVVTA